MYIKCWGARGSLPVSGPEYVKYGGNSACLEIRSSDDRIIIIDAGTGIRRLGNKLLAEKRYSYDLIFTHAHWDHIMGFPFFKPLYIGRTRLRVFGCSCTQQSIQSILTQTMSAPYFPIDFTEIKGKVAFEGECAREFVIAGITIKAIPLSHPNSGLGFRFEENGKSFVFLTDNELTYIHPGGMAFDDYLRFSEGADLLIHDAEYRPEDYRLTRKWGHSVYTDAMDLALKANVRSFGLYHHNVERTDADLDDMVEHCKRIAIEAGSGMRCFGVEEGFEITL